MSGIDVRDLAKEKLPPGTFPAESRADFRLHIAPEVRRGIEQHAKADVSVEICGVLVGTWGEDENGPYAAVTDYIRCDNASSKVAEVTFTHEAWAQINKEMDSKFADKRIVGWYHSHPDFGIFLSERDCFIHEHFFSGPGQVAYVIDPVRDLEGVFAWRKGKAAPLSHFWVGNHIRGVEASQRNVPMESSARAAAAQANLPSQETSSFWGSSTVSIATTALALLTVFLLGYLYGGSRTDWEQRMIITGAVAHFADTKLLRDGLEEEVAAVQSRLRAVSNELGKLPHAGAELLKEDREEAAKRHKFIRENIAMCEAALARIEREYGLNEAEKDMAAQIAALKQAELRRQMEAAARGQGKRQPADSKENKASQQKDAAPAKQAPPRSSEAEPKKQGGPTR